MFDLAWSEIGVIVAVAIIVIGPKDLPETIRGIARGIAKLRRMAGEFQGHLDEVVREAKLEDVRDQIRDIRNFDLKGEVERAVDREGTIRDSFRDDPFRATPSTPSADAAPVVVAASVADGTPPPVDATAAFDPTPGAAPEALPAADPAAPRDPAPYAPAPHAPQPAAHAGDAPASAAAADPDVFAGGPTGPLPPDAAPPPRPAASPATLPTPIAPVHPAA